MMPPLPSGGTLERETSGPLNQELEQIIRCTSLDATMRLAESASVSGSAAWNNQAWLTVASCANSRASSDPARFALCIFAHEQRTADVAVVDALVKRARIIVEQGPSQTDPFRDPEHFFNGLRAFVGNESPLAAVETFQLAMNVVFTADRQSPEWAEARLQFIRARRLRQLGQALRSVADRGVVVPPELADLLVWAEVSEIDGRVVISPAAT
jgi:hypothetical protein